MSERLPFLVEAYLDGALSATDAVELAGALRTGQRGEVRERLAFTGLLVQALDRNEDEAVVRSVLARLDAEGSASGMVRAVQRSIAPRRPGRRTAFAPWLLAAAALLALGFGWWLTRPQPVPAVPVCVLAAGTVQLARGPAAVGTGLLAADHLTATSSAVLRWDDGSEISLAAAAEATPGRSGLRLDAGTLDAAIAPQPAGAGFVIATPAARIEVVGTRFRLVATADSTRCDLHAGAVRLIRNSDGRSLELAAGQTAVVAPGTELAATAMRPAEPTWNPLFPASGLDGWQQQHGSWENAGGVVRGASPNRGKARLLSIRDFGDLELACRIRITGAPFAEVQVGDYNWFFEVPARDGAWIELRLTQRGDSLVCTADGAALAPQAGDGRAARPGPLGFYVMPGGTIEIDDAKTR